MSWLFLQLLSKLFFWLSLRFRPGVLLGLRGWYSELGFIVAVEVYQSLELEKRRFHFFINNLPLYKSASRSDMLCKMVEVEGRERNGAAGVTKKRQTGSGPVAFPQCA